MLTPKMLPYPRPDEIAHMAPAQQAEVIARIDAINERRRKGGIAQRGDEPPARSLSELFKELALIVAEAPDADT